MSYVLNGLIIILFAVAMYALQYLKNHPTDANGPFWYKRGLTLAVRQVGYNLVFLKTGVRFKPIGKGGFVKTTTVLIALTDYLLRLQILAGIILAALLTVINL